MNDLLMKFYQDVIQYESDSIELGKQLDNELVELLKPYEEQFSDDDIETIKSLMYQFAYEAEECGFLLGGKVNCTFNYRDISLITIKLWQFLKGFLACLYSDF